MKRPAASLLRGLAAVCLLAAGRAPGATNRVTEAILQTRTDIQRCTDELNRQRDAIAAVRVPLAAQQAALEREVLELRHAAEHVRAVQGDDATKREALQESVHSLEAETALALTALQDYRRSLETRAGPVLGPPARRALDAFDQARPAANDYATLPADAAALLELARQWNLARLGGETFPDACLDRAGRERAGEFVVAGPMVYFAATNGVEAGIVGRRLGSVTPTLLDIQAAVPAASVATIARGGEAVLPVDTSGGDALRVAEAHESLWQRIRAGGAVMIPLAGVGLLAIVLTFAKIRQFHALRTPTLDAVIPVLDRLACGDVAGAEALARAQPDPLGQILREGVTYHAAPRETLEEMLHERLVSVLPALDRHLGMLAVLGGVAPLLGLLGTVTGIIHTFRLITLFGSGDARILSGGIAEALITTQTGLVVAIPVVLTHAYLSRRLRTIVAGLEQAILVFVSRLQEPAGAKPAAGREST